MPALPAAKWSSLSDLHMLTRCVSDSVWRCECLQAGMQVIACLCDVQALLSVSAGGLACASGHKQWCKKHCLLVVHAQPLVGAPSLAAFAGLPGHVTWGQVWTISDEQDTWQHPLLWYVAGTQATSLTSTCACRDRQAGAMAHAPAGMRTCQSSQEALIH